MISWNLYRIAQVIKGTMYFVARTLGNCNIFTFTSEIGLPSTFWFLDFLKFWFTQWKQPSVLVKFSVSRYLSYNLSSNLTSKFDVLFFSDISLLVLGRVLLCYGIPLIFVGWRPPDVGNGILLESKCINLNNSHHLSKYWLKAST